MTRIGISFVPNSADLAEIRALARAADQAGLDCIGIQDHPYQRRFVDTFSLLAALAAETERITLFPDVANLPLRPPAVMAKAAATIDLISGGRFELGLGAGGFWDAIAAMGGGRKTPKESVDALVEGIEIIRLMWSDERTITFDGEHYDVRGLHPGPKPAHEIGIWLGAYKPRMLRLVGTTADGWMPSLSFGNVDLDGLKAGNKTIDEAATGAGRDPTEIRRLVNVTGKAGELPSQIDAITDAGFDTIVFWPDEPSEQQIELLAELNSAS